MKKKNSQRSRESLMQDLNNLYRQMEEEYNSVANQLELSCADCDDNCCSSYFQHHTYIEWAFLWRGILECSQEKRELFLQRAKDYVQESERCLKQGKTPNLMCPLNSGGWCEMYEYRLMICRLHGVPNQIKMPNGSIKKFPGCIPCQKITAQMDQYPALDRTPLYIKLVELERQFTATKGKNLPKVDMTIAEMLVNGAPPVP